MFLFNRQHPEPVGFTNCLKLHLHCTQKIRVPVSSLVHLSPRFKTHLQPQRGQMHVLQLPYTLIRPGVKLRLYLHCQSSEAVKQNNCYSQQKTVGFGVFSFN